MVFWQGRDLIQLDAPPGDQLLRKTDERISEVVWAMKVRIKETDQGKLFSASSLANDPHIIFDCGKLILSQFGLLPEDCEVTRVCFRFLSLALIFI